MIAYDSKAGWQIGRHTWKEVACILHEEGQKINVKSVQQQTNGVDSGVFALAFATNILQGKCPENTTKSVEALCQHFHQCLVDRRCRIPKRSLPTANQY